MARGGAAALHALPPRLKSGGRTTNTRPSFCARASAKRSNWLGRSTSSSGWRPPSPPTRKRVRAHRGARARARGASLHPIRRRPRDRPRDRQHSPRRWLCGPDPAARRRPQAQGGPLTSPVGCRGGPADRRRSHLRLDLRGVRARAPIGLPAPARLRGCPGLHRDRAQARARRGREGLAGGPRLKGELHAPVPPQRDRRIARCPTRARVGRPGDVKREALAPTSLTHRTSSFIATTARIDRRRTAPLTGSHAPAPSAKNERKSRGGQRASSWPTPSSIT